MDLNAAFDDALTALAADGLPEGKPPPQPWFENIRPIAWPDMSGRYAPRRRFVALGWIPRGCVTSIYGTGGIGKSLLAQMLGTAVSLGRHWLGIETERCRVLALFCEDDADELWRRQERINETLGVTMADLAEFLPNARTGDENVLARESQGVLQTTELFDHLAEAIAEFKPGLVILDNIAQLFAGNENDRAHVTQFVNQLARLARDGDCAVVLLGHVAKAEGSAYSGSTAWDAAVRSRMLLAYEGQGDDQRLWLRQPKSNYSEKGSVELEWRDGMLHAVNQFDDTPAGKLERGMREGQANQTFLDALDTLRARGVATSESKQASTYAPKEIAKHDLARDFSAKELAAAMQRLFNESRIIGGVAVSKGKNRCVKYGLGRAEWATEPQPPTEPTGGTETRSVHCTPVGSANAEPTNVHAPGLHAHAGSTPAGNKNATETQNQNAPAWADLDHWRRRLREANGSREERANVVREWGAAAGGILADGGLYLPADLTPGLALAELKANARDLGLMPKTEF
jgi:KaiC/GvpD/RAD55 family RecA-like ATPase